MAISIVYPRCVSVSKNCHLASPLTRSCQYQSVCEKLSKYFYRSVAIALWLRHCLGQGKWHSFVWILSILMDVKFFYSNIPYGCRTTTISIFSHILLRYCLGQRKVDLARVLARSCRYLSVCQNYQNIPNGFSAIAIFANWPRTDRQTNNVIIGHSSKVNLSIGRLFSGACNFVS